MTWGRTGTCWAISQQFWIGGRSWRKKRGRDSHNCVTVVAMDVREPIDKLSVNAAAGPDGVPAILLKKCKDVLSHPLACLWQKSLLTGEIPDIFKLAFITPIHKAGSSRASPENYRPVSLTSHLVKTFERILKKKSSKFP